VAGTAATRHGAENTKPSPVHAGYVCRVSRPQAEGVDLRACFHISPTRQNHRKCRSSPDARQLPGRAHPACRACHLPGRTQLTYPAKRIPPTRQMTRASHPPEASGPLHGQSAHLTYPARTPRPPHRPKAVCPPASHEGCQPTPDLSSTSPSASSQSSYPANPGAETIGTPFNTRD
jgi:hypothetical protein